MKKALFTHTRFSISFCLLMVACIVARSQQPVDALQKQFAAYHQQAPQEKIFVHSDKSFYLTGESIWFKLYNLNAGSHKISDISKVAYVEVINHDGKPVLQAKVGLSAMNGSGSGSFVLPAHLGSGNYMIRAYTQWMRNFDESYFFQKAISIVNTSMRPDWMSLEKRDAYRMVFFPEGGNLVYGLQSRVGFRITNQFGEGMDAGGAILDERNDTVARFESFRFGIGSFSFIPKSGSSYRAVALLSNGASLTGALPQIYQEGHVMNVSEVDANRLRITLTSTAIGARPSVYLLAHTRQEMKMALAQNLSNGRTEWIINKDQLGEGISALTIFNENRQPVCERLYFKRPAAKMNVDVTTNSREFKTRSRVDVSLVAQNERSQPVTGELSMSVFLLDSLQSPDPATIESYVWLTSDLNGEIESPAYYMGEPSKEVETATDNLMLTHGWRRFRWENLQSAPLFNYLPEFEGLTINAKVVDKSTGKPASGIVNYLSVAEENFKVSNAVSNERGEVAFVMGNVFGPNDLVMQTDSNSNRYRIDLQDPFASVRDSLRLPRFKLPITWKDQLNDRNLNTRLLNSYHPVLVQQFVPPVISDTAVFFGTPDKRYFLDDFTRFPTMEEVMREFVEAVRVRKVNDRFRFEVLNLPAKLYFGTEPLVMLDGVPLFDPNKMVLFDPLKIKKIDIVGRRFFWGNIITNGIVSYTTYEGDLAGFELDPAAVVIEFQGLQLQREFYQPDYSTEEKRKSRLPDARNVLAWKPILTPDAQGKTTTGFYTSDLPGTYVIMVQGLSSSGTPGSKLITINVRD